MRSASAARRGASRATACSRCSPCAAHIESAACWKLAAANALCGGSCRSSARASPASTAPSWHLTRSRAVPPVRQVEPASEARVSDTTYKLDAVFDGGQPTQDVYVSTAQGLIRQVVSGFNSTVFAYGQVRRGE